MCIAVFLGSLSCTTPGAYPDQRDPLNIAAGGSANLQLEDLKKSLPPGPVVVGFDLDDTLYSSTPAFEKSLEAWKRLGNSGQVRDALQSEKFWIFFNNHYGASHRKKGIAARLVELHKNRGDTFVIITARGKSGEETMTSQVAKDFGLTRVSRAGTEKGNLHEIIYTDQQKKAKSGYIRQHNISVYYGDSDSDIVAAREAGIRGIRVLRSVDSAYLADYHPGSLQEEIVF